MMTCSSWRKGDRNPSRILLLTIYLAFWCPRTFSMCPARCNCNDITVTVWCGNASLDVVPITLNPELKEFHLDNNRIKNIKVAFTFYQNLEFLDISHNRLESLSRNSFREQGKLQVLHLYSNRISTLKNDTFTGLSSLKVLRLDENILVNIDSDVFHPLNGLETLDLSQNLISSISPSAFLGLINLKNLLLRENKLTQIPTIVFLNILSLQTLDMGLNTFETIPENSFYPLSHLKSLSLDSCGVQTIDIGAFKSLESITTLFLQDNELSDLPIEAFADLPQLQELHIGQNRFKRLKPCSFQGLTSLKTLTLNGGSELETIENGAFSENALLERIIITHNSNLNHIDPDIFHGLNCLRFLSLRGNNLSTFDEDMLFWEKLDAFDIRDNPLICNCNIVWLRNVLRTKGTGAMDIYDEIYRVKCVDPPHMSGMTLASASLDDLDC